MIVQCEKCQSKFRLDDALVKKEGTKVRCSVCRYVFRVYPPEPVGAPPPEVSVSAPPPPSREPGDILEEEEAKLFETGPGDLQGAAAGAAEGAEDLLDEGPVEEDLDSEMPGLREPLAPSAFEKSPAIYAEKPSAWKRFFVALLILILLLAGGAAAVWFWAPDWIPDSMPFLAPVKKTPVQDSGTRQLALKSVTGAFLDSEQLGPLFLIRGEVQNNYPGSRSFIRLKGSILDENGQVVVSREGYAGNLLNKQEISKLTSEQIAQAMENRYGEGGKNLSVEPGGTVPFTLVFEDLPENIAEFTVEAVGSSPAT